MNLDFLFFGAHPDDVEIGCGGTIACLASRGYKVGIIDLTRGELGTRGSGELRLIEADNAAKILGVELRENLLIADGNVEVTQDNKIKVVEKIRQYRPKVIFTTFSNDRHPDHIQASKLIKEAYFYSGLPKIKTEFSGIQQEAFRPEKLFYYMTYFYFEPSFVFDISKFYDQKINSLRAYESQFYDPNSDEQETLISKPDFFDYIKSRNQFFGFRIGKTYAEPYFYEDYLEYDFNKIFEK